MSIKLEAIRYIVLLDTKDTGNRWSNEQNNQSLHHPFLLTQAALVGRGGTRMTKMIGSTLEAKLIRD